MHMLGRLNLRFILFLTLTLISAAPVLILSTWVQKTALEKEVAAVKEKHLLVARNLTGDLTRYIIDVESSFTLIARNLAQNIIVEGFDDHIDTLYFRYISMMNSDGTFVQTITKSQNPVKQLSPSMIDELQPLLSQASQQPDTVFYSDMTRDQDDLATFYLIKAVNGSKFIIGSLSTRHVIEVQQKVSFGKRGHAAIVDQTGRAIAHPIDKWVAEMKDMSFLPPVKSMLQRKTGVSQFYTPAMQADMVAGYTFVPIVGWGVMVPQPFEELEARAQEVRKVAINITLIGIAFAGIISWFLAGVLARPAVLTSKQN